MKLILKADKFLLQKNEKVVLRILALNDSYEAISLDRRLLIGPNIVQVKNGVSFPVSVEPSLPVEYQNIVILNPWSFYGRERSFELTSQGKWTVFAYLLSQPSTSLLAEGPAHCDNRVISAEKIALDVFDK